MRKTKEMYAKYIREVQQLQCAALGLAALIANTSLTCEMAANVSLMSAVSWQADDDSQSIGAGQLWASPWTW